MMKLDKKDLKILYELDKNSTQTYTKLAKKVGLSQESVRYRVKNLVEKGIIQKYFTVVDASKLGYAFYKVLLRLHNVNEQKQKEMLDYLTKDKDTAWVVALDGNYDIGFVVKAENIAKLNYVLEKVNKNFSRYISKKVFSVNIEGDYLSRSYLIDNEREEGTPSYTIESEKHKIDDNNFRIIKILTEDGNKSAVEIAKELGVSPDSIVQRRKRLEKQRIITKYSIVLDNRKMNQIHYKVLLYINDFSPEKISKLINFCKQESRIIYIVKALGEWNYELDLEVENVDQYRKIMMKITNSFSDIVRDYNSLIVRKIHKYNLCPS